METKIELSTIIAKAKKVKASDFAEYLNENNIAYQVYEQNTNLDEKWFHIALDNYGNTEISFLDGDFDLVMKP
jgi:hypothetical protein